MTFSFYCDLFGTGTQRIKNAPSNKDGHVSKKIECACSPDKNKLYFQTTNTPSLQWTYREYMR